MANETLRVYLDNCCFNRPYDDQRDILVHIETEAKLVIQQMIKNKELTLIWSDVLDYENNDNPFDERRIKIAEWENLAALSVAMNDTILEKARTYMQMGLRQKDASHLACAVYANAAYFITVDKKILHKSADEITLVNPVDFLRRLQDDDRYRFEV
jgi:predicted nucleic acid-binding protein